MKENSEKYLCWNKINFEIENVGELPSLFFSFNRKK